MPMNRKHVDELAVSETTEERISITFDWMLDDPDSYRGTGTDTYRLTKEQAQHLMSRMGDALPRIQDDEEDGKDLRIPEMLDEGEADA